ncbi:MAG TPA: aldehyde ferredoxin oxidoreductase N-terminal domain-containing protein [archaeon]|nr:aldehyde ferredoxin oxidoreductase N-terminal domain-containing protein [archaeon]
MKRRIKCTDAILRIDLSKNEITKQPLDETIVRNFIGGRGLNSKTLFDEVKNPA